MQDYHLGLMIGMIKDLIESLFRKKRSVIEFDQELLETLK